MRETMEETTKIGGDDEEDAENEGRHVFFEGGHDFWMILVNAKSIVFDRGASLTTVSLQLSPHTMLRFRVIAEPEA